MKKYLICIIQLVAMLVVGILVKDSILIISVGLLGIAYSFLTSVGKRYGFLLAIVYCILYAYINFKAKLYATAFYNIAIMLPSLITIFFTWGKKQNDGEVTLTSYNAKGKCLLAGIVLAVSIGLFFLVRVIGSSDPLLDTFFFTTSICACFLFIVRHTEVFVVLTVCGIVGTIMWLVQVVTTGTGYSVLMLNALVLINAIIGLIKFYHTKKKPA